MGADNCKATVRLTERGWRVLLGLAGLLILACYALIGTLEAMTP